jgi:hypothetical protein
MAAECWGCAMGVPRVPPDRRTDPLGTGRKVIGETIHQLAADVRDEVNPARWRVVVEGTARPAVEPGELKGPLAEELLQGGAPTGVLITGRLRHGLSLNPPRRYDARDHRLFHRYMAAFERAHGAHSKASRVGARFLRRGSEAGHKVCNLQVPGKIGTFWNPGGRPACASGNRKAAVSGGFSSSGGGIRTRDLRVMSPTSYLTGPPRVATAKGSAA